MPRLIITADDCGVSEGINQTIYDLHRQGYISAASVMTNFPAQRHALELLRTCPDLDLGAHLTLTDGFPLSHGGPRHARVLNDDRSFRNKFSLYLCAHFFNASTIDWLRHELDAQLGRFTEVGIEPRHISTHHHFHAIPALRRIVHELAADYGVDWVRGHDFRASFSPRNPFHRAQHKSLGAPFDMPDYMTAIQANMSRPVEEFCGGIAGLEGTVEIIAHPGPARDPGFPADMNYGPSARFAETQYLIRAIDCLREGGLTV